MVERAFPDEAHSIPVSPPATDLKDRYDLATALGVVREMETTASRSAVYEEIKAKNLIYRLVDKLYRMAGTQILQPLILFAYMLKCVVSLGPFDDESAEAAAISNFPNEHKTIARITALVPDVAIERITVARGHIVSFSQIREALFMIAALPRLWSFLKVLVRRHSFMPSARIASALAFYMRFSRHFAARPQLKSAIVASNYSPEAVGMSAAAHQHGRRVIYSNHAPVPANGAVVPPVLADCAIFYGNKITQTYQSRSRCIADIGLIGQPGTAGEMQWREKVETVGIFLTAGTKADALQSLIATIRVDLPTARIIVRQHPVTLLKTDFSLIGIDDPLTQLTIGNPLDDEIAACDMVICGNSGVAMNVLSGGRPVAYLSSLDGFQFDANGFVASRLVISVPWWTDDIYDRLKGFYNAPGWRGVMQSYDASYGADIAQLRKDAVEVLMRHLRPGVGDVAEKAPKVDQRKVA
ncbi:hypothetical protein NAP1_01710 [Erythrobacter sp. NAP1]|uniref:hypothetical protein n=1 Tax=Erythrobacter sp. NAP1 TaxID=237727 RepID=UPI0000686DFB|nr:hypothetical protein [Erythrobacter sp. NAP1]EAQ29448.1 hypothetical protein NAP1_01710 [Erythrobacter sp. NAP1]